METEKKLYDFLVGSGDYTKSFNEFQSQFSNDESKQKLHEHMLGKGSYTKTWVEFQNQFFPTQVATVTPTSTSTSTYVAPVVAPVVTSEDQLKIEQSAIRPEFWDKLGGKYKREYFSKNEDNKWAYTNPESGKVVVMEDLISSTSKISKLLSKPLQGMLNELNDEEVRIGQSTVYLQTHADLEEKKKFLSQLTEIEVPDDAVVEMGFAYWTNNRGKEVSAMQHSDGKWYVNNEESAVAYDKRIEERKEVKKIMTEFALYSDKNAIKIVELLTDWIDSQRLVRLLLKLVAEGHLKVK